MHTVVARGVIASLPGNKSTLQIHHEAIPGWVRPDGGKGMSEMVMPFEPKSGVSLEGFAVGDAVEFTVEITPGGAMPNWRLASIGKLPAGTELRFQATTSTKAPPTTR